jgi:hypothetical protein
MLQDVVHRALSAPRTPRAPITDVLSGRQPRHLEIACNASAVRAKSGDIFGTLSMFWGCCYIALSATKFTL